MLYAELGAGGGRTGPKPVVVQSNYAEVKLDEFGYPASGPSSDRPQYATSNKSRGPPPQPPPVDDYDDDFSQGVVV